MPEIRSHRVLRSTAIMLLGVLTLTGCVSPVALTKPDRESIRAVSIQKNVKVPDAIFYLGGAQAAGMAFGLVGGLIAGLAAQGSAEQFKAVMREGQIDLGQIVRDQFEIELREAGIFPLVVPDGGDAEIGLEIQSYGLYHGRPALWIVGSLVRTDGAILWKLGESLRTPDYQAASHDLEEYRKNPQLLREGFTAGAKFISGKMVRSMLLDYIPPVPSDKQQGK
jgi:hypothetical protein